jgi:hypothetical protein
MWDFQRDPHIFQDVMLGLIARAMAINDQSGGAFLKWAAKRVHTRYGQGHGLHNARAAALLRFLFGMDV